MIIISNFSIEIQSTDKSDKDIINSLMIFLRKGFIVNFYDDLEHNSYKIKFIKSKNNINFYHFKSDSELIGRNETIKDGKEIIEFLSEYYY